MGDRAVITTSTKRSIQNSTDIGVYLHWNGDLFSVTAFLAYCKRRNYRPPEVDNYGWARLCQVIGNYFGGGLSLGIGKCNELDCNNYDNGTYIIKNWEIIDRRYKPYVDDPVWSEDELEAMIAEIDSRQPQGCRLCDNTRIL